YVYALNNAGTVVLGLSLFPKPLDALISSSAISGGSSAPTLYTTAAQTNLPIQYVGKFLAPQSAAGTWSSAPSEAFVGVGYDYAAGVSLAAPMICANNAGLSTSVATNALTITLTQSDGATAPSASSPVYLTFRNSTATTGGTSVVPVTSSLSVTIPS